jgi:hypothetical protein
MRKIIIVAVMGVLLVLLTAGAASAATDIQCPGGNCFGTNGNDRIFESPFFDNIFGGQGKDIINAGTFGGEVDNVNAGPGNDRINTNDNDPFDTIRCGGGNDVVKADSGDRIVNKSACERINRS